jgi:hypothetical protein
MENTRILKKEIPFSGRNGVIRSEAVLERGFFDWDSFSLRYGLVDSCGVIPEEDRAAAYP